MVVYGLVGGGGGVEVDVAPLDAAASNEPPRVVELPKGSRYFVPIRWSADGAAICGRTIA